MTSATRPLRQLPIFERRFWDGDFRCTQIGTGALGGKASGLVFIKDLLSNQLAGHVSGVEVNVPTMAVIATDCFDQFLALNHLSELAFAEMPDDRIAHAFLKSDLPTELVGDLRALATQVRSPLAIRSSSLLEDAQERPFAGVYATKMIPNNHPDTDTRFRILADAIKFVYASTFFREARDYRATVGRSAEEKMAVIIQEVVGHRRGDKFYPEVSGVARSYNFYAFAPAQPADGVVTLALGLGKTIVDGGVAWNYSPAYPRVPAPFADVQELLRGTQTTFWAINMRKPPNYDPVSEIEYMVECNLQEAEFDGSLDLIASTYDPGRNRVNPGTFSKGPRIVDFAPVLIQEQVPFNNVVRALLCAAEGALGAKVEIEFALTLQQHQGEPPQMHVGFLQVRPMVISDQIVDISASDLRDSRCIVSSNTVMGNGTFELQDIVFVIPEKFSTVQTPQIAQELEIVNRELQRDQIPYLLIGFGRWGSSHPSLGIPVEWSQISGAQAIVETTLPELNVELSQGSHFFHNLSSFRASYFMVRHDGELGINWDWLKSQPVIHGGEFICHARSREPLEIRVDGRTARGLVQLHASHASVAAGS